MTDVDVAVVGAGVSGLSTAPGLRAAGREVHVFEAGEVVGGRMRSRRVDGYLVDEGAETIASSGYPSTWALVRELGIGGDEILPVRSLVAVWRGGRAHPGVGHPVLGGMLGGGLSMRGRLELTRATAGLLRGMRRFDPDHPELTPLGVQTVSEFARPFRQELFDYLLQPAVGTAFGWRPQRSAVGPMVATMLATRGIWRWRTYRDGMDTLARRLAERLPVSLGRRAVEVHEDAGGVRLTFADGDAVTARAAVLAVPAPVAAGLQPSLPPEERPYVEACTYAPMLRVTCLLDRPLEPARRALSPPVYALLVPEREDPVLGGLTIEHRKAANRAPAGAGLVSLLSGPTCTPELIGAPDGQVVDALLSRAEAYLPGLGAACRASLVHRFPHGAPEASPAALRLRAEFLRRPARRVDYAGDWLYQRPSSEGAVRSSALTVPRVLEASTPRRRPAAG